MSSHGSGGAAFDSGNDAGKTQAPAPAPVTSTPLNSTALWTKMSIGKILNCVSEADLLPVPVSWQGWSSLVSSHDMHGAQNSKTTGG
ncbi:uncharacterized protein N7511_010367 [Penicillium nucicola]|uniref:uncharacterized protein n=1 Tax=Penicillium nucicola TaxID=1850975 RepID=UPI002544EE28|nr:uncharacterized protein N7511_010367 [Penicillium nucicola]KAJ5748671.1 hypothetical protein N7511_010367 [Penicillium nucicola]